MKKYDVIVAGFGTAGSIAAIAAARAGASVLVVERNHYAGGTHTGGFVETSYIQKPVGLMKELWDKLDAQHAANDFGASKMEENKHLLEAEALRCGVEIRYGTSVVGVEKDGNTVTGVRCIADDGTEPFTAYAHTVIDSTAEAVLCALAGAELRSGRESDGQYMPFTNTMLGFKTPNDVGLENFDAGRINQYREPEYSQTILRSFLAHLNKNHHLNFVDVLPADLPGIREGRNIVPEGGYYTLGDVLDGSEDAKEPIAYVYSNLDTHANDMPLENELIRDWMIGASMWGIQLWFPVPRGALHPQGVRGLLAAARHLGVEHDISYAQRMIALMGMVGEAAGLFAAEAAKTGVDAAQVPYAAVASKLDLPKNPLENNRKFWALSEAEILAQLDSDKPGTAMWSARRSMAAEKLRKAFAAATPGSRLRRHLAMTLALKNDASGVEELRAMAKERDPYAPTHSRKYNHRRGYVSLYFLGKLADPQTLEIAAGIINDPTLGDNRYEYLTHALVALLRIGEAHPECRARAAELVKAPLENPQWQITSRLKGTENTQKRMDAVFRCAGAAALDRWQIPHKIREALLQSSPDEYELDLLRR